MTLPATIPPPPSSAVRHLPQVRPVTRGDCVDGPRPCQWTTCAHHIHPDTAPVQGGPRLTIPGESCTLDVADRGGVILEAVGAALGVSKERVRQMEASALRKLRASRIGREIAEAMDGSSLGRVDPTIYGSTSDESEPRVSESEVLAMVVRRGVVTVSDVAAFASLSGSGALAMLRRLVDAGRICVAGGSDRRWCFGVDQKACEEAAVNHYQRTFDKTRSRSVPISARLKIGRELLSVARPAVLDWLPLRPPRKVVREES